MAFVTGVLPRTSLTATTATTTSATAEGTTPSRAIPSLSQRLSVRPAVPTAPGPAADAVPEPAGARLLGAPGPLDVAGTAIVVQLGVEVLRRCPRAVCGVRVSARGLRERGCFLESGEGEEKRREGQ